MSNKYDELKKKFKEVLEIENQLNNSGNSTITVDELKTQKAIIDTDINLLINTTDLNQAKISAFNEVLKDLEYQKKFISELPNQEKTVQMSINRIRNRRNRLTSFNNRINGITEESTPNSNSLDEFTFESLSNEVNGNLA